MRTCWLNVPEKFSTMTDTIGSLIYWPSAIFMSSASMRGVLPTAGMSLMSGVVIRPSGRTWTFDESSGLRHTKMFSWSSGPITYSSPGCSWFATKGAGGKADEPAETQPLRLSVTTPARGR